MIYFDLFSKIKNLYKFNALKCEMTYNTLNSNTIVFIECTTYIVRIPK